MATPQGTALVGHLVKKHFCEPNTKTPKLYTGRVKGYDEERRLYHVVYEDSDEEEMDWEELKNFLSRRTLAHVVTPGGESDSEEKDEDPLEQKKPPAKKKPKRKRSPRSESDYEYEEDNESSDELDASLEDEQDEDFLVEKKPPAKKKPPSKKQKRAPRTRTKKALFPSSKCSPRSIAARGLPQGSRAVGRGGFEVRSLDGISPLLTTESVGKAIKLVAAGQHQAAARLLQTEHDSIKAFCKAASKKLGMDPGGVALEGGSELSERARDRLHKGTVDWDADLPGRLLVVRAGTALSDATSEPLCPSHVVDCVFASAAELHAHTKERLATYAMDSTHDPAFGPWNVMIQRLHSADLLPRESDDDNDDNDGHPKRPFVVSIEWKGGHDLPVGSWQMYCHNMFENSSGAANDKEQMQWALIEGATRDAPPVILGVSPSLIAGMKTDGDDDDVDDQSEMKNEASNSDCDLLPPLSSEIARVRLPASLLQKAIRRNFCSAAPLLEACSLLLHGKNLGSGEAQNKAPRGGVFEMLRTTWRCMLEDASPFDAPDDGSLLGFEELLLLSLVATADPSWKMPPLLLRKAVAAAIRAQKQPANFSNIEKGSTEASWTLQEVGPSQGHEWHSVKLQNALLVMRAAIGGKIVHRSSLEKTAPIEEDEATLIDRFEEGVACTLSESRLEQLDDECRLAACDPQVAPAGLLLLQATLPEPPVSWKKHSLPSLAKQVSKLITEANARLPDHHRLMRLAAWGNNNTSTMATFIEQKAEASPKLCSSAREIVTSTGKLSDKEHEIVDCFEAVQRWREGQKNSKQLKSPGQYLGVGPTKNDRAKEQSFLRAEVGAAPTKHDGRIAFLLAFAKAEELEVHPKGGKAEVVNVLFCGDSEEPLLVQRIGKARKEAAASLEGPESGSSGAKAVPSLGYVQRSRSINDRLLVEAAERAVAQSWKDGRIVSLPLPPQGFQWNLTKSPGQEEQAERAVRLTAIRSNGVWQFTIGGIHVAPFDARNVISPCSLDTQNHKPATLGPEREQLLKNALYVDVERSSPELVLRTMARLHELAVDARQHSPNEGHVYDWLPMATAGRLTCTIWRDAILALKTREKDDLVLGPVLADGTCKRDMTEGCLFRIFSVLESLYPTALIRNAALKWRVRPRGAQYHHMIVCLEQLSRGLAQAPTVEKKLSTVERTPAKSTNKATASHNRPKRRAAAACKEKVAFLATSEGVSGDDSKDAAYDMTLQGDAEEEFLPLPQVTTELWPHQEASVTKVVEGIKEGRRGHADASAVGAGKTLTALATIVRLTAYVEEKHGKRNGVLVMLPTKALVKEWLLQIAEHTSGFHVVEQREDGQLFSLTYAKSTPPIDGNTIVISTLDRVREHPFTRQAAWDFVVIDECLAVQNAAAKRCPSAWRQIEVSTLGVLMLSATFFRSKYSDLFYMIRMLRTPFPRSMQWLSAVINEHIVCQVPETDRTWQMRGEPVPLPPADLAQYRKIIEVYKRKQLNNLGEAQDFRRLFVDLEAFLRRKYEGRDSNSYKQSSVMAEACFKACESLLNEGRRPLVFADTQQEAEHLLAVLCARGLNARTWSSVSGEQISGCARPPRTQNVIVAVKSVEGQGVNMQHHADAIVCRPTPGDHLEQMKGRIDRPGQTSKKLFLVVLMAEHTIEEAKFANIHLAGNFFREYIAPVATRYRERIDLEATLAAGGTTKLKRGTVSGAWQRSLEAAGRSGAFARIDGTASTSPDTNDTGELKEGRATKRVRSNEGKAVAVRATNKARKAKSTGTGKATGQGGSCEPKFAPLNKVLRNKGDPEAVREAKRMAKDGHASLAVRRWLFPPKQPRSTGLAKESLMRFSDATPPLVLDSKTVHQAVDHLSKDTKLAALISRVGAQALIQDCGEPETPTQAKLFNYCVRSLTFTMVSVDAGNAFLRRLAIKIGVCIENMEQRERDALLKKTLEQMQEGETSEFDHLTQDDVLELLLAGKSRELFFTPALLGALVKTCLVLKGKQSGYPHLCGVTFRCGKHDNHQLFLKKAREHAAGGDVPVSAGYSASKASFLISMVHDFECGKITAEKIAKASDREAAKMLIGLKGIGDWCAGGVLVHFLKRANIMLYGDLTIRNYLNDLYEINQNDESETMLESAADFPDTGINRNLIDAVAAARGWEPYRSVVCLLMYHLQEENLVLL